MSHTFPEPPSSASPVRVSLYPEAWPGLQSKCDETVDAILAIVSASEPEVDLVKARADIGLLAQQYADACVTRMVQQGALVTSAAAATPVGANAPFPTSVPAATPRTPSASNAPFSPTYTPAAPVTGSNAPFPGATSLTPIDPVAPARPVADDDASGSDSPTHESESRPVRHVFSVAEEVK